MTAFGDSISASSARIIRNLMRHRERYLKAWIALTGLSPDECELVEEVYPMGPDFTIRTVVTVRRRRAASSAGGRT